VTGAMVCRMLRATFRTS